MGVSTAGESLSTLGRERSAPEGNQAFGRSSLLREKSASLKFSQRLGCTVGDNNYKVPFALFFSSFCLLRLHISEVTLYEYFNIQLLNRKNLRGLAKGGHPRLPPPPELRAILRLSRLEDLSTHDSRLTSPSFLLIETGAKKALFLSEYIGAVRVRKKMLVVRGTLSSQ